jgi:hypothetical protein
MAVPMATNGVNSESNRGVLLEATAPQPTRMNSSRESFASPLPRPKSTFLMAESPTEGHVKKVIGMYAQLTNSRLSGGEEAKPFFPPRKKLDIRRIPSAQENEAPVAGRRSLREIFDVTSSNLSQQNEESTKDGDEKSDNHQDLDRITDSALEISDDTEIKRLGDLVSKEAVENFVERERIDETIDEDDLVAPLYPPNMEQDHICIEPTSISDGRVGTENTPDQVVSSDICHAVDDGCAVSSASEISERKSISHQNQSSDIQISVQSSPEARSVAEEEGSTIVEEIEEFTIDEESYYEEDEIPESAPASPVNRAYKMYEDSFAFSIGLELHSPEPAKDLVVLDFRAMEHGSLVNKEHLQMVSDLEILMCKAKAEKEIEKLISIKKNRLRVLTDLETLMKRPKAVKETENRVSLKNQRIRVLEDLEKLMEEKANAHEELEKQKSAKEKMLSDLIETSKTWNLLDDDPRESKVNLSTERVADLITHINACDKANTPVRWDLLGALVSTEGVEEVARVDKPPEKSTFSIQEMCDTFQETTITQKHPNTIPRVSDPNMEDFPLAEDAEPEEAFVEVNDMGDEEEVVVTFRHQYNLSEGDMTDIVAHLELCEEMNTEIRWDLINQIISPDDSVSLPPQVGDHSSAVTDSSDSATSGFSIYPELSDSILSDVTFLTEAEATELGNMANKRASKVHPGLKRVGSLDRIEEFQQADSKPDSLYAIEQPPVLCNSDTGRRTSSRPASSLVSKLVQLTEAKNVPDLLLKQRVSSLWESKTSANNPPVRGPFYRSLSWNNLGTSTISPEKKDKDSSVSSGHEPSKLMSILSTLDLDQSIIESPNKKADARGPADHADSDNEYFYQSIQSGFEEFSVDEEVEVFAEDEESDTQYS